MCFIDNNLFFLKLIFGFVIWCVAQEERSKVRQKFFFDNFFSLPETEESEG